LQENSNLIHLLNQTVRLLNKRANETLNQFGLYHSQWSILYCLKRHGQMTQKGISHYLNVEAPTVTRTIQKLEANGWVCRSKGEDRRQNMIELSEKAVSYMEKVEREIAAYEDVQLARLTEEEKLQLESILNKMMKEA